MSGKEVVLENSSDLKLTHQRCQWLEAAEVQLGRSTRSWPGITGVFSCKFT